MERKTTNIYWYNRQTQIIMYYNLLVGFDVFLTVHYELTIH